LLFTKSNTPQKEKSLTNFQAPLATAFDFQIVRVSSRHGVLPYRATRNLIDCSSNKRLKESDENDLIPLRDEHTVDCYCPGFARF
jgi:hypothetical protein